MHDDLCDTRNLSRLLTYVFVYLFQLSRESGAFLYPGIKLLQISLGCITRDIVNDDEMRTDTGHRQTRNRHMCVRNCIPDTLGSPDSLGVPPLPSGGESPDGGITAALDERTWSSRIFRLGRELRAPAGQRIFLHDIAHTSTRLRGAVRRRSLV